ncbi:hypothetical protein H0H93_014561, partial [Arthromyces matolae]
LTFTAKDPEGGMFDSSSFIQAFKLTVIVLVKIYTHLDTNADGQQWLARYTGNQNSRGEKFYAFKTMDKSAGVDYYLGYASAHGYPDAKPVTPRTTADEWIPEQLEGAKYMIASVTDKWADSYLALRNGVNADNDASLVVTNDLGAVEWILEEIPLP